MPDIVNPSGEGVRNKYLWFEVLKKRLPNRHAGGLLKRVGLGCAS